MSSQVRLPGSRAEVGILEKSGILRGALRSRGVREAG